MRPAAMPSGSSLQQGGMLRQQAPQPPLQLWMGQSVQTHWLIQVVCKPKGPRQLLACHCSSNTNIHVIYPEA